jgi:hypothetical protein
MAEHGNLSPWSPGSPDSRVSEAPLSSSKTIQACRSTARRAGFCQLHPRCFKASIPGSRSTVPLSQCNHLCYPAPASIAACSIRTRLDPSSALVPLPYTPVLPVGNAPLDACLSPLLPSTIHARCQTRHSVLTPQVAVLLQLDELPS